MQIQRVTDSWFIARTAAGVFFSESQAGAIAKASAHEVGRPGPEVLEQEGFEACLAALANQLSVWIPSMNPYPQWSPQWIGWRECVSQQAQELRKIMESHKA